MGKTYETMKPYLIFLILILTCGCLYAQETKPIAPDIKKVELRSNSREQAIVKRNNFHQRKDVRALKMNRLMNISKQKRNMNKRLLQNKNRKKLTIQQLKQRLQKQRQRAMRKNSRR